MPSFEVDLVPESSKCGSRPLNLWFLVLVGKDIFYCSRRRKYVVPGMWMPCPRTNTPIENIKTPSVFQTSFLEAYCRPGNSGDCHVWKLATDPSPPHSADGSSAADISPGGFSAAGLWKAPLEGPLTRVPRERRQLLALRSHLSSVPVSYTHLTLPTIYSV